MGYPEPYPFGKLDRRTNDKSQGFIGLQSSVVLVGCALARTSVNAGQQVQRESTPYVLKDDGISVRIRDI